MPGNYIVSEEDLRKLEDNVRAGKGLSPMVKAFHKTTRSIYRSKLEAQYAQHLDMLVKAGEVKQWWYEPTSFKLSKGKRFRPDFLIQYADGLERRVEYVEIKSRFNKNIRDGLTHLKWCAQLYPCFTWRIVYWKGGGWDAQYVEV